MFTYSLKIAYDGTSYSGWQRQPNGPSIQQTIEEALRTLLQEEVKIVGSGRTDAGVHALGQVAHFKTDKQWAPRRLVLALNGKLPPLIRILEAQHEHCSFHASRSASSKCYHYHIWFTGPVPPQKHLYTLQLHQPLDLDRISEAIPHFVGRHDFASFANCGSSAKTTVRNLFRLELIEQEGGIRLEFEGEGFLYKMVRNIVGTLIEIGQKRLDASCIPALMEARDRRVAGRAASARGLFLMWVTYPTRDLNEGTLRNSPSSDEALCTSLIK